jgi:hypothetical protein
MPNVNPYTFLSSYLIFKAFFSQLVLQRIKSTEETLSVLSTMHKLLGFDF